MALGTQREVLAPPAAPGFTAHRSTGAAATRGGDTPKREGQRNHAATIPLDRVAKPKIEVLRERLSSIFPNGIVFDTPLESMVL
jgi:hypothetical protein